MKRLPSGKFFGRPTRRQKIGEFAIVETCFSPNSKLPEHKHEHDVLIIMSRGARRDKVGGRTIECRAGSMILHSAEVPHENQFMGFADCVVTNVMIPKRLYSQYFLNEVDSRCTVELTPEQSNLLGTRIEFEISIADDFSEHSIQELVIEFADRARNITSKMSINKAPWILDVLVSLDDNFLESSFLTTVAQCVGKHPAHVARTFRQIYGMTMGEYLRNARLFRACSRLARSKQSIVAIAAECGFSDQAHLTRCMRSVVGSSPSRYRQVLANQSMNPQLER